MTPNRLRVGILALQGDFDAHRKSFEAKDGVETVLIKSKSHLTQSLINALVLPGGETTTHIKALKESGLWEEIPIKVKRGLPLFATCAGLILSAQKVENPEQESWGFFDIAVRRNGWGRQRESFIKKGKTVFGGHQEMVFIRAPRIMEVGDGPEILGTIESSEGQDPVLIREGSRLGATFHPELSEDQLVIDYFLDLVRSSGYTADQAKSL